MLNRKTHGGASAARAAENPSSFAGTATVLSLPTAPLADRPIPTDDEARALPDLAPRLGFPPTSLACTQTGCSTVATRWRELDLGRRVTCPRSGRWRAGCRPAIASGLSRLSHR